ncbi:MAG: hypothetical protein HQL03_04590 [Nitrospirae bacterium]|nr:hypothetical protein [Nitrospirota bacterium]MBF0590593.1 hypothetical protein [Nitrospirota bacterium]
MRKVMLLAAAIVMVMTVNGVYAAKGFKKHASRPTAVSPTPQPPKEGDISGRVMEVSYGQPPYIVIGETRFSVDKAVFKTMSGSPISISSITKGKKVKIVYDKSRVVTNVFLYPDQR